MNDQFDAVEVSAGFPANREKYREFFFFPPFGVEQRVNCTLIPGL
jgi:hypothetical protein